MLVVSCQEAKGAGGCSRPPLTSSMVMPFSRSVMIFVMPSARYSQVSTILSRSGPLGMPRGCRVVVTVDPLGGMLNGRESRGTLVDCVKSWR